MKQYWYENDWSTCIFVVGVMCLTIVANYFYHGGRIVW